VEGKGGEEEKIRLGSSSESKPECTGTPFWDPVETEESIPGPQNVSINTRMVVPWLQ